MLEGLTPLTLSDGYRGAAHQGRVGIVPGSDVECGQVGDIARDSLAEQEGFEGFGTSLKRAGVGAA